MNRHFSQKLATFFSPVMIGLIRAVFALSRALGPERAGDLGAFLARNLNILVPKARRTALDNLAMVYPDKSAAERKAIAREAWENLGRTAAEYAHLGQLFDFDAGNPDPQGRIEIIGIEHFVALRDDAQPGIIFSAHLANWELPAIAAARYGLETTAVFRAPNDPASARIVHEIRSGTMGGLEAAKAGAAYSMQAVLERGGHLGMLIDQHFTRGVVVPFMGHEALTNPIMGKFAKRFDCPVHGVRVMRLPGCRFRLELTPPLDLPRDANGEINVVGAMAAMNKVVSGWIDENPGQWLWMHRRWRPQMISDRSGAKSL
ncbi:MAG: lipid A biosynthesis lauroyl acyltransferase [Bosea sp. (in: a-proteobacteria)]